MGREAPQRGHFIVIATLILCYGGMGNGGEGSTSEGTEKASFYVNGLVQIRLPESLPSAGSQADV